VELYIPMPLQQPKPGTFVPWNEFVIV